jgi:transposase, IS30 family
MPVHLTVEQRQLALRLRARGLSLREIGPQVGCSHEVVRIIARQAPRRPLRFDGWVPGPGRLTLADREEISIGLRAGESFTAIAVRLGKGVSTVSREVAANGGRSAYRAWRAHQRARAQARRPKTCKMACPQLAAGHRVAGTVVVAGADLGQVAHRAPRRSHDVGEPRNHLPGAVRPGPR